MWSGDSVAENASLDVSENVECIQGPTITHSNSVFREPCISSLTAGAAVAEGFLFLWPLWTEQCLCKMLLDGLPSKSGRSPVSSDRNLMGCVSHRMCLLLKPKRRLRWMEVHKNKSFSSIICQTQLLCGGCILPEVAQNSCGKEIKNICSRDTASKLNSKETVLNLQRSCKKIVGLGFPISVNRGDINTHLFGS